MDFIVEFYETDAGVSPVREFLDELKVSDPDVSGSCSAVLQNFETGSITASLCPRALRDGLFELRHTGKLNTRVLWFFARNRRIILVHGIRNKGQAIAARDISTALERMREWRKRVDG